MAGARPSAAADPGGPKRADVRGLVSWALYDWANSAFPTVVVTFVFATYFTQSVSPDPLTGTKQWALAMSASALAVAVMGPVFGAIADHSGARKPWLGVFTVLCIIASAALWWVRPEPGFAMLALLVAGFGNFAFETGMVFYNAMLPGLAPPSRIGRISGWGWGLGYAGGLLCLALVLLALVRPEVPWFGLSRDGAENIRASALLVAAWYAVFAVPLFVFTADRPVSGLGLGAAVVRGLGELRQTVRNVRALGHIVRFLIARMIYTDGLNTLYAFGGIYAAGTFGMDFSELIVFAIAMNVTAGLGAAGFGWVDDWIGPKKTVLIAICGLALFGGALIVVEGKTLFWAFGLPLGLFVGPAQAASRSMMARMAPPELTTEMFGLYALSGKATAFLGPALLGWVTVAADSQRAGMATILVFFAVGFVLLLKVPETPGIASADGTP